MENKRTILFVNYVVSIIITALIYFFIANESVLSTIFWYFGLVIILNALLIFQLSQKKYVKEPEPKVEVKEIPATVTDVSSKIIMQYMNKQFPEWIELDGTEIFQYSGIAPLKNGKPDVTSLKTGLYVTNEGVVYEPIKGDLGILE